jgi:hypothetical protein
MPGQDDLARQVGQTLERLVEVVDLEPEENSVAIGLRERSPMGP